MNSKTLTARNVIFFLLIAIFAVLLAIVFTGMGRVWGPKLPAPTLFYLSIAFFALASAMTALTVKLKEQGLRKLFFLLAGVAAVGIPVCVILHNLVYSLFFSGKDSDEPVFFILAIIVFPALFIIGTLGSITMLIKSMTKRA